MFANRRVTGVFVLLAAFAFALAAAVAMAQQLDVRRIFPGRVPREERRAGDRTEPQTEADRLFEQKQYKEAAELYAAAVEEQEEGWRRAAERLIICRLRLALYDDAIDAAEDFVERTADTPYEARAERLTAHLYMLLPHWGTRSGGEFYRGEHRQGIRLQSWTYDKKHAVAHMQRARELYARFDGVPAALAVLPEDEREGWHTERIEAIFDLVNLLSRFTIYDDQPHFWYRWWGERDEFLAETAGEDDFDEGYSHWQMTRQRPIGLRIGPDGSPLFPQTPDEWAESLPDQEKMLFLLEEVRRLDKTRNAQHTALSYYRQAMLARKRFGMDRLNTYGGYYAPLQEELQDLNPWECEDDEAFVLAGGRIVKTTLPRQFDVLGLLRTVVGDYADSGIADQSQYAVGLYYQSRQQYLSAIAEYEKMPAAFPESRWTGSGRAQIARIRAPQVQLSQIGVQAPGQPAVLEASYRNVTKLWFTARRIDVIGMLAQLQQEMRDDKDDYWRYFHLLQNWSYPFVTDHRDNFQTQLAGRHLGPEVARWASEVEDDGTHRYAHSTLQTALDERGAYLIYAYLTEPPAEEAELEGRAALNRGNSRAAAVLEDVALVEKRSGDGNLYFIADAETGAPIEGAEISVMEFWRTYDQKLRKSIGHTKTSEIATDDDGLAVFRAPADRNANLHLIVDAPGEGKAWSGMGSFYRYHPSRMRDGRFAYVITDRPVYRPEQTVRFKVWLRQMREGILQNAPNQRASITVYDPRGDKVHQVTKNADQYGGLDGEFVLDEEPPLGVYRIEIGGRNYVGGQNFRVEEYKKPEFEVTVEPSATHAKLGEKLTAVIRADYYFGAPVTEATVNYRVFREEYTHSYYFPGYWDWLYGPGYGYAWYSYDWFPWWRGMRSCWSPPHWWWGYQPRSPVRELVHQGEQHIGEDGTVEVEIDTAPALRDHPDRDHRYIVQAEVRDASRRVIEGEGDIKVTRQAYYAFIQSDRGYYRPGEEMVLTVRCLTPDNEPVRTEGVMTVSRVVMGGPDNAHIEETELDRWTAATDARGIAQFRLRHERSDQLKVTFEAADEWGGTVRGNSVVWVCGRDFDGRLYRFNDLELLTDKRTYQPGDTARLMINTRRPDSYVLFADEVDNGALISYRMLHLQGGHTIVDVPIEKGDQPNIFVEAATVGGMRVHQQVKRICVPPEDGIVELDVQADKPEYKPGEEATVRVKATDLSGEPADVQVVLSAFDRSVLYIQSEFTPPIAKFFHGQVRSHYPHMTTNLLEQLAAWGNVRRPFQHLSPYPPGWTGTWGVDVDGWSTISDAELAEMAGGAALGFASRRMRGAVAAEPQMAMEAADAAAPMGAPMAAKAAAGPGGAGGGSGGPGEPEFAEAQVRTEFADTALWTPDLATGAKGEAEVTLAMPENLTTWKINGWAMSKATKVGEASTEAVTTKNLLVRLQAPRFFMEYDEVVISANVHNYLASAKTARVSLEIPEEHLAFMEGYPARTDVEVPADGEVRVDWRVKVLKEGTAALTVTALTDEESDAMRMIFPVLVHGMTKQDSFCGSMRPDEDEAVRTISFTVPEQRRPELTRLEVQFAPSLVGAMMDALPYCLDYPYGCTEQTVSRFLPAVLTLKTLQNMGIDLEEVRRIRGRMDEIRRIEEGENRRIYAHSPIFDSAELDKIIRTGLSRIETMQHGDGGWSWWKHGSSSGYLSSYVLNALLTAQECDIEVDGNMVQRGLQFLAEWEVNEMRKKHWSPHAQHAFVAYVLARRQQRAVAEDTGDCVDRLYEGRDKLGLYGKALLSMALADLGDEERARIVLRNIMQYLERNDETEVAWFRTPNRGWWYWWNSDIETNAWCLRAIVRLEPKSDVAPRIVKWLLENRRNGYYWRSTRDTTLCVSAMSDFVLASGEGRPDYTLTLNLDDGAVVKQVTISSDNFFTCDNRLVVEGVALEGGEHTLTLTKDGPGALYYSAWVRYFTKEEDIPASGLQLKIDRSYFLLRQIPYEVEVEGSEGQKLIERRLRYERVPLADGDAVGSGDLVQVELRVTSDNDYTYLMFEDPKPAGCEAVELRSGGEGQEGFYSYMELRDEKVAFFVDLIGRGEHLLRYRLRAEVPGIFHALPAVVQGMYVPELRGNSDEHIVGVEDR